MEPYDQEEREYKKLEKNMVMWAPSELVERDGVGEKRGRRKRKGWSWRGEAIDRKQKRGEVKCWRGEVCKMVNKDDI